jgi:hypothetical protein
MDQFYRSYFKHYPWDNQIPVSFFPNRLLKNAHLLLAPFRGFITFR